MLPHIHGLMDPNRYQKLLLFFLCCSSLQFSVVSSDLIYYGNNATERSTSGMDSSIQPTGPRIWIDDPLNCDSCPRFGYLQLYYVYIHALSSSSSVPLPRLFLQIWSNTTAYNNYTLKWQKSLDNYQPGQLYKVAPDAGQVVEVNERDRIGFTSEGNGSAIALDLEIDDTVTASTAHRTYFWLLYRDNYALPSVGDYRYVDNNALRGRFSIGVLLDNAPPRKSTEVYIGHDLIRRQSSNSFYEFKAIIDESVPLVSGRVTAFYFRLAQLTTSTSVQLYIWKKTISNAYNYTLTYNRSITLNQGSEQTYNVSINDGPQVDNSHRFGWNIPSGLFYSQVSYGNCHYSLSSPGSSYAVGQTYEFDGLSLAYETSMGVIVDQPLSSTVKSSSSDTHWEAPSTYVRTPDDGGVSTTPFKPAAGKSSDSLAIHRHRVSILGLVVTLHLLIAYHSS